VPGVSLGLGLGANAGFQLGAETSNSFYVNTILYNQLQKLFLKAHLGQPNPNRKNSMSSAGL